MIDLYNIPTSNTLTSRLMLNNNGVPRVSLDPNSAKVLDVRFNEVFIFNPPHQPIIYRQIPPQNISIHPGNIAYFDYPDNGNGIDLCYSRPGEGVQRIEFR